MAIQIHYWSKDVERLLAHYVSVLGFELDYRQPEEGAADFCILTLGEAKLMIAQDPAALAESDREDRALLADVSTRLGRAGPVSVYIAVDDVDAQFAGVADRGGDIIEPLWSAPWGLRQFSVRDPDGNLTTFHNTP
ncbi:MAG: VOC family protein [Candidatus Bipolaricaulota bacterium]|nr:MAG: VOC family protein [Candidatus Bipolaricaulota bacterium]